MEKTMYEQAELEIIELSKENVIVTSGDDVVGPVV